MSVPEQIISLASQALQDEEYPLLDPQACGEYSLFAEFLNKAIVQNRQMRKKYQRTESYLRDKINQMLQVIGTIPLRPEELDDETLISLDPLGIIAGSFSQILDHQRETNEKLEIAMEEINAIFETVGGGILVLDAEQKIISYNKKFSQMFCEPGLEIIGHSCRDIVCQGSVPLKECGFLEMVRTGKSVSKSNCPRDDRSFNIVVSPVRDKNGNLLHAVILYIDVTELMQAKAVMAQEKERLSITLESIGEGVVATDSKGYITLINRAAEELTGWSGDDAVNMPVCNIFNVYQQGEEHSCSTLFEDVLRDPEKIEQMSNITLKKKKGAECLISLSAAPIRSENDNASGIILVFRDITKEKRLDEEMAKSDRIDSIGVLAGGIAHDFNNLMSSVLGNVSLAKKFLTPQDKLYGLLDETEKSTRRAKGLTQQLLTFAKGGAPIINLVSLKDLIEESARFSSSGSHIKCGFSFADDLWSVNVDTGQIGQVIQNLVINASQAMPSGGTVRVSAENILLDQDDIIPLSHGKYVRVDIKDSGKGIEKDNLDKIFDPYFSTKKTGHGLGLAICFSIVKKHGGHIFADSVVGEGSTFTLYLPASEEDVSPSSAAEKNGVVNGYGRILVMDDEEMIRDISETMLRHMGYQVEVCVDGEEAIELYRKAMKEEQPYDAVIMDLTIPGGMGGKEAIEKIMAIDPTVKAIVSSGYANDPIMASFRRYGFIGVVPKPYSMDELSAVLQEVFVSQP
jgi:PAS domain S-box-containing protein